jgi:hypothetical protein
MQFPVRYRHSAALAAPALLLASSGCTLVIDANADQCASDSDCAAFDGAICSEEHVCVSGCSSNQYCIESGGEYHVCDKVAHQCVNLLSNECTKVTGEWQDDSAFIFGSILPLQGGSQSFGASIEQAILLAVDDFKAANHGLPALVDGAPPRPLVHVSCDDRGLAPFSLLAGKHMVDAGIPAIVGPTFSSLVTPVVKQVTIPGNVLSISPTATSSTITSIEDNGLVWRTAPSDLIQVEALAQYFKEEIVPKVTSSTQPIDVSEIRIAVVHKGDGYGIGLADAFGEKIGAASLGARYLRRNYGEQDDPKYETTVADVLAQRPHVVMVFGTEESVELVLKPILTRWSAEVSSMPFVLASDGAVVPELWQLIEGLPSGVRSSARERTTGSVPGARSARFDNFVGRYNSMSHAGAQDTSPDIFGPAGAYDATYLLAYSAAYPRGGRSTGPALAEGLSRMVPPGVPSQVGQGSINAAFEELKAGRNIDFDGASGPLDFDVKTGEARSNIIFVCIKASLDGASFNGVYFDSSRSDVGALVRETPAAECNQP